MFIMKSLALYLFQWSGAKKWLLVSLNSHRIQLNRCSSCVHPQAKNQAPSKRHPQSKGNHQSISEVSYKETSNLPVMPWPLQNYKTDGRCNKRETFLSERSDWGSLYEWQLKNNTGPDFVIHDGPPYANGDLHSGHSLNKIIKDVINKYRLMKGHRVIYRPGWDCHGLPIENKMRREDSNYTNDVELRERADEFSTETVNKQKKEFISWGLMGDWNNPYITSSTDYITRELEVFQQLYDKGFIYRDYMPVYWSPVSATALAESELEYNKEHVSKSIYVSMELNEPPAELVPPTSTSTAPSLLIWTTVPWTIPANQAIAFNETLNYVIVECSNSARQFIIAQETLENLQRKLETTLNVVKQVPENVMSNLSYKQPISGVISPVISSRHVKSDMGTGLVHIAPSHGHDDFKLALKNNISTPNMVDESGCFNSEAPQELIGLKVDTDGNNTVMKMLGERLILIEDYQHHMPYDWRSKTPVIIRTSHQWFINTSAIVPQALECLDSVDIYPPSYKKSLYSTLESRPYWCISRQRAWGVRIPACYGENNQSIVHRDLTEHIKNEIRTYGKHVCWTAPTEQLFPKHILAKAGYDIETVTPCKDILDIWFDSGISWYSAAPQTHDYTEDLNKQANMYIEGVDQIRGWFQSSLLTSVALTGKSPYKSLLIHGFTVDSNNRKMSKSEGNVIAPGDIIYGNKKLKIAAHGIDLLRWWASIKYAVPLVDVGADGLKRYDEQLLQIRSRIRYMFGCLNDFDINQNIISYDQLLPFDKYQLHVLSEYAKTVEELYDNNQLSLVMREITRYENKLSSNLAEIKPRLYDHEASSTSRRSAQTVLYNITEVFSKSIAPILSHTAEECYHTKQDTFKLQQDKSGEKTPNSIFTTGWYKIPSEWTDHELSRQCNTLKDLFGQIACLYDGRLEKVDLLIKPRSGTAIYEIFQDWEHNFYDRKSYDHSNIQEISGCASLRFMNESEGDIDTSGFTHQQIEVTVERSHERTENELLDVYHRNTMNYKCVKCWRFTATRAKEPCDQCVLTVSSLWADNYMKNNDKEDTELTIEKTLFDDDIISGL